MEEKNKIIEIIKRGCSCGCCHNNGNLRTECDGFTKNTHPECACTQKCRILAYWREHKHSAEWFSQWLSPSTTSSEAIEWIACAHFAKELGLGSETVLEYQKKGIQAYDKMYDFHSAKKYSENFGLTELAEYYQKIIDLMASRPR